MKNTNRSSAGSFVVALFALFLPSPPLIREHRRTSVWNVYLLITPPRQDVARVTMVRPLCIWQRCVPIFSYFTPQPVRPQGLVSGRFPDSQCQCVCICVYVFSSLHSFFFTVILLVRCLFLAHAAVSQEDRLGRLTLRWQLHCTAVLLQLSWLRKPQGLNRAGHYFLRWMPQIALCITAYTV